MSNPAEPKTAPDIVNRDISFLLPKFNEQLELLLDQCHAAGLMIFAFECRRTFARQALLYSQGRGAPGKVVTNAGSGLSMHNWGAAADLVFDADAYKPGIQWTWNGNYKKLGEIIKDGFPLLEWAGTWKKFPEYPHVQLKTPYSASQLKAIFDQVKAETGRHDFGVQKVWELLSE